MIAIYARISKSDAGSSIENQIGIVKNYLESEKIEGDIKIFVDDGYSGRCSYRPAFVKMLAGAASGEIDVIAVKDFSRFGRNHMLVSELTEVIFRRLEVRFISVADRYDSYKSNDEMLMAFKSIFNEYYCVDISNKIKSVLHSKNVSGDYAISKMVYGYKNAYKEIDNFNIPVCALTANAITGMREEYLGKGFNDYLSKPIVKEELNRVIKKYLKK